MLTMDEKSSARAYHWRSFIFIYIISPSRGIAVKYTRLHVADVVFRPAVPSHQNWKMAINLCIKLQYDASPVASLILSSKVMLYTFSFPVFTRNGSAYTPTPLAHTSSISNVVHFFTIADRLKRYGPYEFLFDIAPQAISKLVSSH